MSPRKPKPFEEMDFPHAEDHPLDVLSRNRMSTVLNDNLKAAVQALVDALGSDITQWIDLEALINASRKEREAIMYNLGFEHGMVAGRSKAFASVRGKGAGKEYRQFADEMRKQALLCELPRPILAAALLEVAWSLTVNR